MSAVGTAGSGEAMGKDAAVEVAAQFPLGDRWRARPGAITSRLEMPLIVEVACTETRKISLCPSSKPTVAP